MKARVKCLCLMAGLLNLCPAQDTEGLIAGQVTDAVTSQAIPEAKVTCSNTATNTVWTVKTTPGGLYTLPLLPPGVYRIQVEHEKYQSKEQFEIQVSVAGSVELNFALRRLQDIWESSLQRTVLLPQGGVLLDFYGPDVDPNYWTIFNANTAKSGKLEASISDAVSPADIRELPLAGQNIYTILLAEPGVAASNAITRSLGIAANGQRPSSSNFLLDGADANFYLVSGPVLTIAPEAVQEYRLSTNNFQAEFGGAAGYIANAVTRSGGDSWHGEGFLDLQNTALNANDFQDNVNGLPRAPSHQDRLGGFIGGRLWKDRLFSGTSLEYFRSRAQLQPQQFILPNATFLSEIGCPSASIYCQLLRGYPVSRSTSLDVFTASVTLSQPVSADRWLALQRLDYAAPGGAQHISLRLAISDYARSDFIWSPYRDYISGLDQPVYNVAGTWTGELTPTVVNRSGVAWSDERLRWSRAHPELGTPVALGGNPGAIPLLPGSPAAYSEDNSSRYFQIRDDVTLARGPHILKAGGGGLRRLTDDDYGLAGEFIFCNILHFGLLPPSIPCGTIPAIQVTVPLARGTSTPAQPNLRRAYRSAQWFAFVQDTFRVSSRLALNFGLRYDRFGSPAYDGGVHDWTVQFGTGPSIVERIKNASLQPPSASSSSLFSSDNRNLAPRLGFAYDLWPPGHTLLRGGFGLFYDRLFDNLWLDARKNSFYLPAPVMTSTFGPIASVLPVFAGQNLGSDFPNLMTFQPHLRNGYAEDFFLGIQTQPAAAWSVELNSAASLGRRLITTDVINRNSLTNEQLPAMSYLSNQGLSDYYSLSLVTRWRARHGFVQAAYTWSHAIDFQSDPLAGDYLEDVSYFQSKVPDLVRSGVAPGPSLTAPFGAAFSSPYDSRGSRGNADFDQRQTLVFYSYWQIPAVGSRYVRRLLQGLRLSQIAAIRSGFPYSIFTAITNPETINAYARWAEPVHALLAAPQNVPGGKQLFTASKFCENDSCADPSTGRNQFAGPGLVNLDVSASRVFAIRRLGEGGSLIVRADAFNFLNHANLNPPSNLPGANYGIALYGRPALTSGFPSVIPLGQTARQIQLMLRLTF